MSGLTRRAAVAGMGAGIGAALAAPWARRARAEEAVLNVYNWADYIGETTIADFEAATGISVNYDHYASTEEMQAKMLAGRTGYDVVNVAGSDMPRFIAAGILARLDRSKLPSWGNLDPEILRIFTTWDPENAHGMPYMWGSVGMTYNLDLVRERLPDADLESLDVLFRPENLEKLADCGVSVLDSPLDVIPMTLNHLGLDGRAARPEDFAAAVEAFRPIRHLIQTFDNNNYINALPNGELCVVNSWSGDYATAKARAEEAGVGVNLAYFVPRTGAPAWADAFCIPADAPHPENAHRFLEFMLQPEVIATATNYVNYANANAASKPFVDPAILADPAIYPDAETITRMWAPAPLDDAQDRALTRAWTEIRSG
jgi:putrescine transport system substrate-binding protein